MHSVAEGPEIRVVTAYAEPVQQRAVVRLRFQSLNLCGELLQAGSLHLHHDAGIGPDKTRSQRQGVFIGQASVGFPKQLGNIGVGIVVQQGVITDGVAGRIFHNDEGGLWQDRRGGSVLNLDIVSSITEFYESIVIIDVIQSQRIGKKKLWF